MARSVGIERLHALLNEPASADVLARCYHFTPVQFFDLMRTQDVFNVLGGHFSTIYLDTGGGFVAGQEVRVPIRPVAGPFQLHFDLPAAPGLQTLRWDPIEGRTCRVRIDAVDCVAADGGVHSVESSTIATNGIQISPGSFDFETNDPNIWWPTSEGVKQVIVKGHWEFDQLPETVQELRRQIVELKVACETVPRKSARATLKFARRVLSRLKVG